MFEKAIPQYCKMMKLSRREILKELYSKLKKLITKTRIEEEEEKEEEIRSTNIEIIENPRESLKLASNKISKTRSIENISINPCISPTGTNRCNEFIQRNSRT